MSNNKENRKQQQIEILQNMIQHIETHGAVKGLLVCVEHRKNQVEAEGDFKIGYNFKNIKQMDAFRAHLDIVLMQQITKIAEETGQENPLEYLLDVIKKFTE
ncbi:hypothetical protein [Wielerella bovis]|uniref:hypothetical protein n=1 Tax=Wielerella bovis TaxID=2917790 RepID=UPI00201860D7|nr:hypothetical protein [Wielerella bovis]ULJ66204.1 hypothetical protein MIS31_07960 [Wielerella bovis]